MRISLIGPGIMTIPPPGHGAVEILMWDYFLELKSQGHEVDIINKMRASSNDHSDSRTPYCQELIQQINSGNYDFVHIHYDCLYHIMPFLNCKKVGITSHYPYIDQFHMHNSDGYKPIFQEICNNKSHFIFALSKKDYNTFEKSCQDKSKLFLLLNGSNHNEIQPALNKTHPNKSIYIGKVEDRKLQKKYCQLSNIDFYGKCYDNDFNRLPCYKGEQNHEELMKILSNYGNLVLLSNGENGTPLVIKEALMAGIPIVTNEYSADDLDMNLPFIDIIPHDKLNDFDYIQGVINENLKKQHYQNDIRNYGVSNFSWDKLISEYANRIYNLSQNA